ncbi:endo-1,4-beta-xylanase [Myxococcota bacterium]
MVSPLSLDIPGVFYNSSTCCTEATFTDEIKLKQAERYREFLELFRSHGDVITGLAFWGIADDNTWLSEFSSGRADLPLLFDVSHQPKNVFDAVVDF